MDDFERTLNPGTVPHWDKTKKDVPVFVKVKYRDGRLSLTGVEGPLSNGDAVGGFGQIVETLARKDFVPTPGDGAFWWRNLSKLRLTWERWHLNDMRPECPHQRAAGWLDKVGQSVTLYHWWLDDKASAKKKAARDAALTALEKGYAFEPTKEQTLFAALEDWAETRTPECPDFYEQRTGTVTPSKETKKLGWLRPDEHPDGLLCRPCPECGYKYGSEWKREEVPESVLQFLYECPETTLRPAWV